ncbi:MAG: MBL fold metallo-hydrolase [Candidatus Levybacteria bacterium]|nr:MBL fold metallo-hydrolase [Candidatus Levybacteria bacterium]
MRKKVVLISIVAVFSLTAISTYQYFRFFDGKLHLVFCNVGQGDAIYIRTPKQIDILVDGGPDEKVLSCLANHMPFWDRQIDLVVLTHPHADHIIGLLSVLKRYQVMSFATEELENDTVVFIELTNLLKEKKISQKYLSAGNRVKIKDGVMLNIVSPTKNFLRQTSPDGKIVESGEFGSLAMLLSYNEFDLLLTGDSQASQLETVQSSVDVLQVPHHGSKTGLTEDIIQVLYPKLAVISVGKNNYGHPNREIIGKLEKVGSKILRTDKNGDIEIVSDGKRGFIVLD